MKKFLLLVLVVLFAAIGASAALAEQHVDSARASSTGKVNNNDFYWNNWNNGNKGFNASEEDNDPYWNNWSGDHRWNSSNYDYYSSPSNPSHPLNSFNNRPLYDSYHYSPSVSPSTYNTYHEY
jgi:hypothetical protein